MVEASSTRYAVLLSIRPKWCSLIANGRKTIEVRKTRPKLDTPFRCYIYETKGKAEIGHNGDIAYIFHEGRGKVIGEFVCDEIKRVDVPFPAYRNETDVDLLGAACLTYEEAHVYLHHRSGYGWHISELKMYDKPKELSEFCRYGFDVAFDEWEHYSIAGISCGAEPNRDDWILKRPPQSWCYVESLEG